jgi:hypothetical protein
MQLAHAHSRSNRSIQVNVRYRSCEKNSKVGYNDQIKAEKSRKGD